MVGFDIAQERLHKQLMSQSRFETAGEVVRWLGAVQAQDYGAAKWALGLRLQDATNEDIERAFDEGAILRTHVMRPTWHFVVPADIRWLLALTAPRVHAANAYYYRKFELDDAVRRHCHTVLTKALQGGKQLTRPELVTALQEASIASDDLLRFTLIMMHAELEGIVCSGARRGKQFTYALLDERVPPARMLERDEALAELAHRYFTGHGPATVQDFAWWSGLTTADAQAGLEIASCRLLHEVVDGQAFWFAPPASTPGVKDVTETVYLLPNFDEYTVAYKDRSAVVDTTLTKPLDPRSNILLSYIIVRDGRVVGTWKRTLKKEGAFLTLSLFSGLNKTDRQAFTVAAERYGAFLRMPVHVTFEEK